MKNGNQFLPITEKGEPIDMVDPPLDLNYVINVLNGNQPDQTDLGKCRLYAGYLVRAPRWYYIGSSGNCFELEPDKREIYRSELSKLLI